MHEKKKAALLYCDVLYISGLYGIFTSKLDMDLVYYSCVRAQFTTIEQVPMPASNGRKHSPHLLLYCWRMQAP